MSTSDVNPHSLSGRLREERQRLGLSQLQAAERAGVSREQWNRYEKRGATPGGDALERLAAQGFNVTYVLHGDRGGAPPTSAVYTGTDAAYVKLFEVPAAHWMSHPAHPEGQTHNPPSSWGPPSRVLPCSAGDEVGLALHLVVGEASRTYNVMPQLVEEPEKPGVVFDRAGAMAMSDHWMRQHLGHTSGHLFTVRMQGDGMSPAILDGDELVVDSTPGGLGADGIYCLELNGRRVIKRVQQRADGSVTLINDNHRYERETIGRGQLDAVRVLGRVVYPRVP